MLRKEDVILYDLFRKKVVEFINDKFNGEAKNKDFNFYVSRTWIHIDEPMVKQLIKTLKQHKCITLEKHKININHLEDWLIEEKKKYKKILDEKKKSSYKITESERFK
jgi:hypothetical protein